MKKSHSTIRCEGLTDIPDISCKWRVIIEFRFRVNVTVLLKLRMSYAL